MFLGTTQNAGGHYKAIRAMGHLLGYLWNCLSLIIPSDWAERALYEPPQLKCAILWDPES